MLKENLVQILTSQTNLAKLRLIMCAVSSFMIVGELLEMIFDNTYEILSNKYRLVTFLGSPLLIVLAVFNRDFMIRAIGFYADTRVPLELVIDLLYLVAIQIPIAITVIIICLVTVQAAFTFGAHSSQVLP